VAAVKLMAVALLASVVMTAAEDAKPTPPKTDVVALVACAASGSVAGDITPLSDREGRYKYAASFSRLPDGRSVTVVMLFGKSSALVLEGVISSARIGVVNVASFQRQGTDWALRETHGGAQNSRHVRAIGSGLARQEPKILEIHTKRTDPRSCVGIGIP
jgi:hypothetical protein